MHVGEKMFLTQKQRVINLMIDFVREPPKCIIHETRKTAHNARIIRHAIADIIRTMYDFVHKPLVTLER